MTRLRGNVLMEVRTSGLDDVESSFRQALEVARSQGALCLEPRAAVSLACLWQDQGKHREARDLVVEVYGKFTEGFGTADLVEANAILQENGKEHREALGTRLLALGHGLN